MSTAFQLDMGSRENWKVNKKSKDYKRLKKIFPECDMIFNLKDIYCPSNSDEKYAPFFSFIAKNFPYDIFNQEPLDEEVYELVEKLTKRSKPPYGWYLEFNLIKTYSGTGDSWNCFGDVTDEGIEWVVNPNEDE